MGHGKSVVRRPPFVPPYAGSAGLQGEAPSVSTTTKPKIGTRAVYHRPWDLSSAGGAAPAPLSK